MKERLKSANPYLPLWEHVPDGEPRVFEYNGEKRVYVYGSHDTLKTAYCGPDQVVWSAPVDDLTEFATPRPTARSSMLPTSFRKAIPSISMLPSAAAVR